MLASCIHNVCMYVCVWRVHVLVFSHSPSAFTGRIWDAYWVTAVVSPVLFIVMFTKGILMALKTNIFKKFFITHILTVIVSFDIHTHKIKCNSGRQQAACSYSLQCLQHTHVRAHAMQACSRTDTHVYYTQIKQHSLTAVFSQSRLKW